VARGTTRSSMLRWSRSVIDFNHFIYMPATWLRSGLKERCVIRLSVISAGRIDDRVFTQLFNYAPSTGSFLGSVK